MDDGEGMGVMAMQSGSSRSAISASSEMIVEPMLLNTVAAVGRAVASKERGSRGKRTPMIAFTSSGGVWDTEGRTASTGMGSSSPQTCRKRRARAL